MDRSNGWNVAFAILGLLGGPLILLLAFPSLLLGWLFAGLSSPEPTLGWALNALLWAGLPTGAALLVLASCGLLVISGYFGRYRRALRGLSVLVVLGSTPVALAPAAIVCSAGVLFFLYLGGGIPLVGPWH